jgi:glycosyltransferase involved in cell wall biosynthesis
MRVKMSFDCRRKIKVMHFRTSRGLFGAERVILGLLKSADSAGFDVGVTLLAGEEGLNRDFGDEIRRGKYNLTDFHLKHRLDVTGIKRLRRFVRDQELDVVHCHDFKSNFYGLAATLNTRVRRLTSFHGSTRDSFLLRMYLAFDEYFIIRFFHRIIVVSAHLKEELKARFIRSKQLAFIPNGIDSAFFEEEQNSLPREPQLGLPPGALTVGIVGRLLPDKGHEHLFQALALLEDEFPELVVLVVGDGPRAGPLRTLRDRMQLRDKIVFTGIRRDMKKIYQALTLFAMPSFREGLPMALLEAMLAGVPVVATGVGGIPDLLGGGERGRLAEIADPAGLAKEIRDLLLNPSEARSMANRASAFVAAEYSSNAMARRTESLYREILAVSSPANTVDLGSPLPQGGLR